VTYGPPPQPAPIWQQPSGPQPPAKRRAPWKLIGGITAGTLVLCCGGFLGLGAFLDDPEQKNAAGAVTATLPAEPVAAPPSTSPAVAATSPSPSSKPGRVSPTPRRSASKSTRPVTKSPRPRPTTVRPTTTAPKPTKTATPKPTRTTAPQLPGVTPGAFCSPEGAVGIGKKNGKTYRCTKKAGEDRARWRPV
jgi:cell division septation protein DedD